MKIELDISALNAAIVSENVTQIKTQTDRLKNSAMEIGKSVN